MSNLVGRSALHPRWTEWGLRALDAFANCTIAIYDPNSQNDGVDFNPYGPDTASAPTLLWQGDGQMAVFRQTLNADDVAGSITQIRSIRFTVNLDGPNLPVRKGLIVRVIACPHDPDCEKYEYTVTSGINGGLSWKRTIEAESDMAVIVGPITNVTP